eukprot:1711434-Rhodomonas_salina.1
MWIWPGIPLAQDDEAVIRESGAFMMILSLHFFPSGGSLHPHTSAASSGTSGRFHTRMRFTVPPVSWPRTLLLKNVMSSVWGRNELAIGEESLAQGYPLRNKVSIPSMFLEAMNW